MADATFSPNGRCILTVHRSDATEETVLLWDASTKEKISALIAQANAINSATFSPDGRRYVTASSDKTAQIRNLATLHQIGSLHWPYR